MNQQSLTYILTASCPGRSGTVDVVTRFLREFGCYVTELNSFDDALNQRFFLFARYFVWKIMPRLINLRFAAPLPSGPKRLIWSGS